MTRCLSPSWRRKQGGSPAAPGFLQTCLQSVASLTPPITVADSLLTAWHKDFPLDECNSIDEIPLPLPGLHDEASSAGIGEAGSLRGEEVKEEETEKENSPTSSNTTSSLPQSLLEKVRAREAAKAVREMTRTEEEKKRIERP